MTERTHYYYMDFLRIFAAYCIVLIHTLVPYDPIAPMVQNLLFDDLHCILNLAVPLFIMMTGALFLANDKTYTFKRMLTKYALKMIIYIFVFCAFFALLELVFIYRTFNLKILGTGILYALTGQSFDHMWYLYMLVGLYLVTPIIKPFVKSASKSELLWCLSILFVFKSVFPLIDAIFKINIAFDIPILKINLFYYILGYYAATQSSPPTSPVKPLIFLFGAILGAVAVNSLNIIYGLSLPQLSDYGSLFLLIIIYNTFILAKTYLNNPKGVTKGIISKISSLCFGIYIIHPLFLHFIEKVLGVGSSLTPSIGFVLLYSLFIFIVSAIAVWIYKLTEKNILKLIRR